MHGRKGDTQQRGTNKEEGTKERRHEGRPRTGLCVSCVVVEAGVAGWKRGSRGARVRHSDDADRSSANEDEDEDACAMPCGCEEKGFRTNDLQAVAVSMRRWHASARHETAGSACTCTAGKLLELCKI